MKHFLHRLHQFELDLLNVQHVCFLLGLFCFLSAENMIDKQTGIRHAHVAAKRYYY